MTDELDAALSEAQSNLDKLRQNRLEELAEITNTVDQLSAAQFYLREHPLPPDSEGYNSLCTYTTAYNGELTQLIARSESDHVITTSGSYIAAEAASYLAESYPDALSPYLRTIETLRQNRSDREVVYEGLQRHNTTVADMFVSAWQSLDVRAVDPARGPAFLMRETLTQFLHHLAPDDAVKDKDWWEAYDERTDITRAHRVRFILEERIIEDKRSTLVEAQLAELKKLIDELSYAHDQKPLDTDYIKTLLYRAQDLLKSLLPVIRTPVEWV